MTDDDTNDPRGVTPEEPAQPTQPPQPSEPTLPVPPQPPEPTLPVPPQPPEPTLPVPPPGDSVHVGAPGEPPKTRKKRVRILVTILVGLLVIGAGVAAALMYALRGSGDVLLSKAPSDSLVFATIYLDPAASQKLNIRSLLSKFPAVDAANLDQQFEQVMDEGLQGYGLSFKNDVQPWLGSQLGVVVTSRGGNPGGALLIASKDDAAAQAALAKIKNGPSYSGMKWKDEPYKGSTITSATFDMGDLGVDMGMMSPSVVYTFVDGTAVLAGSVDAAKQIIDTASGDTESLADNADYSDTMAGLPDARVADLFVNGSPLADMIKRTADLTAMPVTGGQDPIKALEAIKGFGMSLDVQSDGVAMKMTSLIDKSKLPQTPEGEGPHENAVLSWTPEDSYGLVAGGNLGTALKGVVDAIGQVSPGAGGAADQFGIGKAIDALSGDFGLVVNPGAGEVPAGGFLMASKDDAAMQDFLDQASVLITQLAVSGAGYSGSSGSAGAVPGGGLLPIKYVPPLPPTWQTEEYNGVSISFLPIPAAADSPFTPAYAVSDGMAIIASSPDEVKRLIDAHAGQSVTANANYTAAIAHADTSNTGMMFVNFQQIFDGIKAADPMSAQDVDNLKPLKAMVMTSGGTSDKPVATIFILIT